MAPSSTIFCPACGVENQISHTFCSACGRALSRSAGTETEISSSSLTGRLPAQTLLKQRYRVLQPVGKGGMGAVYMAQDSQLGDRLVAVKEMSQSRLSPQEALDAVEAFKREAHLLAGLQHPNLPSIHDHFEESGRWYLVMSFIQGTTLQDYLSHSQEGKLPLAEAIQIGLDLCNVLDYLHTYQPPIIFRDLKPSNIMHTPKGHIYLIDFGIARHFKPGQSRDTAYYGSAGYSPPEQYGQAQTSERSDIYSLGTTLYHILSGYQPTRSPFCLPPLQTLVPTLPPRLVTLITQMLELEENKRPASIKVVQQELQQCTMPASTPPPISASASLPLPQTFRDQITPAAYSSPVLAPLPSAQTPPWSITPVMPPPPPSTSSPLAQTPPWSIKSAAPPQSGPVSYPSAQTPPPPPPSASFPSAQAPFRQIASVPPPPPGQTLGYRGQMQTVGVGLRFLALLIDSIIILVVAVVLGAAFTSTQDPYTAQNAYSGIVTVLFYLVAFFYLILLEATRGATLGKMALGLRVVKLDGSHIGWSEALIRALLWIIDAQLVGFVGAILIWSSPSRQRLGDRAARTLVIKVR